MGTKPKCARAMRKIMKIISRNSRVEIRIRRARRRARAELSSGLGG